MKWDILHNVLLRSPDDGGSGAGGSSGGSPAPAAPSGGAPSDGGAAPGSSSAPAPSGGAAPATPAPSPGPAPSPAPSPTEPTPVEDDFLAGLGGEYDDDSFADLGAEPAPAPVEPQPPQPLAATPEPPPVQPAAPAPQAPAPGPQDADASIPPPSEPGQIAAAMQQNADVIIEHLAQNEFQLSPEDLEALETDVATAVPKLLAQTFLRAQMNTLNQIQRVVPAMMQQMLTVRAANQKNEGKFYSRWPDIKKDQYGDLVRRFARVYRNMNPDASLEQMVEDLGPMVMASAKITPTAQPNGGGTPNGGLRPPPSSPFKPALGGAAGPSPAPPDDPWAGLGMSASDEE